MGCLKGPFNHSELRVGVISSINRITKKITNFEIKITLSNDVRFIFLFPYRVGLMRDLSFKTIICRDLSGFP